MALSATEKAEQTHKFILHAIPTDKFLRQKHKEMSFDANARTVIQNATKGRPTDPVIVGYAGKMSAAAKSIGKSLDPAKGDSSHSVADFGRLPFAPLHAATAGLVSSAMGMQDTPRFNFGNLVSKVTAAAKCRDKHSKAALNVTTTDLVVHVAALAHHFFKEMGARPDAFQAEVGMFASDEEKTSAYTTERFFIPAIGRAEQDATGHAPQLRTAFENTRTNHTATTCKRLDDRWEGAVNATAVAETPPPVDRSAPATQSNADAGSDSDPDMRAGRQFMQQTLPKATTQSLLPVRGSWDPPEGNMDDAMVALAITGGPCAIILFSPSEEKPLLQVTEWDDGIFPAPTGNEAQLDAHCFAHVRPGGAARPR